MTVTTTNSRHARGGGGVGGRTANWQASAALHAPPGSPTSSTPLVGGAAAAAPPPPATVAGGGAVTIRSKEPLPTTLGGYKVAQAPRGEDKQTRGRLAHRAGAPPIRAPTHTHTYTHPAAGYIHRPSSPPPICACDLEDGWNGWESVADGAVVRASMYRDPPVGGVGAPSFRAHQPIWRPTEHAHRRQCSHPPPPRHHRSCPSQRHSLFPPLGEGGWEGGVLQCRGDGCRP